MMLLPCKFYLHSKSRSKGNLYRNENQGFVSVFNHLESADLHTRLAAIRIVNRMLDNAPTPGHKEEILRLIEENNATLSLQVSLLASLRFLC